MRDAAPGQEVRGEPRTEVVEPGPTSTEPSPPAAAGVGAGLLQRKLQRRALQRREQPAGAGGGDVHVAAERGLSGPSQALPHLDAIQRSFGHHDVRGVQAHVGGPAAEASKSIGAAAYATGHSTAFAESPDLRTAAHEAAHVVQQRGGVQLLNGVGQAGDPYEQHADAVADKVAAGQSAEGLLDSMAGGKGTGGGGVQRRALQLWSGHEHRAMGNMGAIIATGSADFKVDDFVKKHGKTDFQDGKVGYTGIEHSKDPTLQDLDKKGAKALRIPNGISFGSASEFGGDFSKTPDKLGKETNDHDPSGSDFLEMALVAKTNLNHFYPLNNAEYRAHHAAALKAAAAGDRAKALTEEGFASHFLEDCFAAGHMAPRALDATTVTGRGVDELGLNRTKDWHDALNAVDDPGGLPTTAGRGFHGDDTMTGSDLAHVAGEVAKSLKEVLSTLAGNPEPGGVSLPSPDFGKIMAHPKYGPIWKRMMGDYEEDLRHAEGANKNGAADNLVTDGGTTMKTEDAAADIRKNVFGGQRASLLRLGNSEWNGSILVFNLNLEGKPAPKVNAEGQPTRVWVKWYDKDLGFDRDETGRTDGTLANDKGAGLNDTDELIGGPTEVRLTADGVGSAKAAKDDTDDSYAVFYSDAGCTTPIGRSNTQGTNKSKVQKPYQVDGIKWTGKTLTFNVQQNGKAVDGKSLYLRWYDCDSGFDRDAGGNMGQTTIDSDDAIGDVQEVPIRGGKGTITATGKAVNSGDTYGVVYLDRAGTIPLGRSDVQP